jgi:hypothetical protein
MSLFRRDALGCMLPDELGPSLTKGGGNLAITSGSFIALEIVFRRQTHLDVFGAKSTK